VKPVPDAREFDSPIVRLTRAAVDAEPNQIVRFEDPDVSF